MLKNLTLLGASLVICLLGVEIALQLLDVYPPPPYPPEPRWTEVYTSHPEYGYALHPTHTVSFDYPPEAPRSLTIRSNSQGFRQVRELGKEDVRPHVLVTGDSFTFGQGVEESERFTDRIETLRPELRVDNVGMTGWGLDMMLLALETVVPRTQPDIVVIAIFYDDFRRVRARYSGLGFSIPRFSVERGELVLEPYPRPTLLERLHLYQAYNRALRGPYRPMAGPTRTEWTINDLIVDRFGELGETFGFETVLLYLPSRRTGRVNENRREWVRESAERRDFTFLDLTEPIHRDTAAYFIPHDGHYTPAGHAVVAAALAPVLDSLVRDGAGTS